MTSLRALLLAVSFVVLLVATEQNVLAQPRPRPAAPSPNHVWVPEHVMADGTVIPGHHRPAARRGYVWVEARALPGGGYVPGYWQPVQARRGYVWVPGHVDATGYWVPGHWRRERRAGHRWVAPAYHQGVYVPGHWVPERARRGYVWVPGHVDHRGRWVEGRFRPAARAGWVWAPGRYERGHYVPGEWRPEAPRRGRRFVPAHVTQDGRVLRGRFVPDPPRARRPAPAPHRPAPPPRAHQGERGRRDDRPAARERRDDRPSARPAARR